MRLEFMDKVKENDILGKSIFTSEGTILLRAGMKFTKNYIEKLKALGVYYVYIEDSRLEDTAVEDETLTELKTLTLKNMNRIMKNLYYFNKNETKECLKAVEDLLMYIIDMGDVNTNLYDIQTYDNYTYVHSLDTGVMSAFLGIGAKSFSERELIDLGKGAMLHDVGKIKVPRSIINKNGKLTDEEFDEIKKHPIYGKEILEKDFSFSENVLRLVSEHHERIDGLGYPNGLRDNQISKFGRIVSICDVYNAVNTDRCYRKKFSPSDSYELILAGSGTSFDCKMVEVFKSTFSVYPLGCCVKLSNDIEGYVIRQNYGFPDRPVIRVLYDHETKAPIQFYEIDLITTLNITVKEIV